MVTSASQGHPRRPSLLPPTAPASREWPEGHEQNDDDEGNEADYGDPAESARRRPCCQRCDFIQRQCASLFSCFCLTLFFTCYAFCVLRARLLVCVSARASDVCVCVCVCVCVFDFVLFFCARLISHVARAYIHTYTTRTRAYVYIHENACARACRD